MVMSAMQKVAYHIEQGAVTMYSVDADSAVQNHPAEWSLRPWTSDQMREYRSVREERYKADMAKHKEAVEEAKAANLPPPPAPSALLPQTELTDRQKAEIEQDTKARAEASDRVRAQAEKDEKARIEAEQIAADKALLASSPPLPDPNERRPFGRTGEMTPKEREAAERRLAEKDGRRAGDDKKRADAESGNTPGNAMVDPPRTPHPPNQRK